MGDWTYNTNHGVFLLKKENIPAAVAALETALLKEGLSPPPEADIFELLRPYRLDCSKDDEGNIIDICLTSSDGSELEDSLNIIAPYVEEGSFLVFYGAGTDGCWAVGFDKDEAGKVTAKLENIVCVREKDMKQILEGLEEGVDSGVRRETLLNTLRKYG